MGKTLLVLNQQRRRRAPAFLRWRSSDPSTPFRMSATIPTAETVKVRRRQWQRDWVIPRRSPLAPQPKRKGWAPCPWPSAAWRGLRPRVLNPPCMASLRRSPKNTRTKTSPRRKMGSESGTWRRRGELKTVAWIRGNPVTSQRAIGAQVRISFSESFIKIYEFRKYLSSERMNFYPTWI